MFRPSSPFLRSSEAPTRSTCIGLDRIGEERGEGEGETVRTRLLSQSQAHPSIPDSHVDDTRPARSVVHSRLPLAPIPFRGNRSTWMENDKGLVYYAYYVGCAVAFCI